MKTLIAYAGKTGTTEKCAKMLAERIPDSTLADLNKEKPDVNVFDNVIIGGSVRMGMINKKAKAFLVDNNAIIKQKKFALFTCNGFYEQSGEIFAKNFTNGETDGAVIVTSVGGELDIAKQHGLDKMVVNAVSKNSNVVPVILTEKIDEIAAKFAD